MVATRRHCFTFFVFWGYNKRVRMLIFPRRAAKCRTRFPLMKIAGKTPFLYREDLCSFDDLCMKSVKNTSYSFFFCHFLAKFSTFYLTFVVKMWLLS